MDDSGSLATPPSERNRVFDVIDNLLLQVNYPWCGSREENSQERRRGCGMWVDGILAWREGSAAVAARGDTLLDGLAGVPVLAVSDVPELAGVGGVEAFLLDGLAGEEPLAFHGGAVGGHGPETVGHHVVGVEAYQKVREELEVVDRAVLSRGEAGQVGRVT